MASNNDYDPELSGDLPSTVKAKQRQTSFDSTNLPSQYQSQGAAPIAPTASAGPVGRAAQLAGPPDRSGQSLLDGYPTAIGDGRTAIYAGVGAQGEPSFSNQPSSLNTTTSTFGAPNVPQAQRMTSLSNAWQSAPAPSSSGQPLSGGLESGLPGFQRQTPSATPQRTSSLTDGYPGGWDAGSQSSQQLPQPRSLSNLAPGDFNGSGAAPSSNPEFASLGSLRNVGDGIGSFSQFNQGDAKLAHDTFQRAIDLRQGYRDQDALARARQQASIDSSFSYVPDSSRPITRDDMIRDARDQRQKDGDQQAIATASGLITARQQQRAADQQYQQTAGLLDLRNAALAPNAPKEAGEAYFKAAAPDKYLQNQLDAPQREATLAETKARTDRYTAQAQRDARNIRGLTAGLQKEEDEDIQAFGATKTINGSLGRINDQIADGSLQLGPWVNTVSSAKNAIGASDDVSSNFASFQATLEKLRNESLRLNKGTQTEGDAQRAWNELFTNIRDPKIVQQRIKEIASYNDAAASLNVAKINNRRKNQGLDELDVNELLRRNQQAQQPAQQQGQASAQAQPQQQARAADSQSAAQQPVYTISTAENFASLPHGAHFIDPQGNHRVKE